MSKQITAIASQRKAALCSVAAMTFMMAPARSDEVGSALDEIRARLPALDRRIDGEPDNVELYSERGDVHFFLGRFDAAVGDYDRMVTLDPQRDASHWRRGIAWFYAGEFEKAAQQFQRYHSFDNVDRENGIWRYLCQVKAQGVEAARGELLKYQKDDRQPFPDVYRLFSGDVSPEVILERIRTADVNDLERQKRLFYAHLYIGLWHSVHDRPHEAREHLQQSVKNSWAPAAGYGPRYMWHVGRLQLQRLPAASASPQRHQD